ncbi:DUF2218 domain-containing protein [Histidinibacterium aquaticum]|uniref:DUF2218 domain-containing protein n=1 Tax=Histidinibacterium aquaticum TaxID=2613962 RepID=A0A5J5GJD3_9RHOB|nr:DUF2218 domain-containing protein [Histidinibacterium aquaticum]KAA9007828.1 DUF2218 domain-containing protein [Histidinibacterium aquaticum]
MQGTFSDRGTFTTQNASKYLQQLCKHFAHKVDVDYDADHGRAAFPTGPARLTATGDALIAEVEAGSAEELQRARAIVDNHLARFAFREEFERMDWEAESAA